MRKGRIRELGGFTIVELMASIVIMAGILALISAFLRNFLMGL